MEILALLAIGVGVGFFGLIVYGVLSIMSDLEE
jgi:hypothetical protein